MVWIFHVFVNLLRVALSCSELLWVAWSCAELLRGTRSCSELLRVTQSCSELTGVARSCLELLRVIQSWKQLVVIRWNCLQCIQLSVYYSPGQSLQSEVTYWCHMLCKVAGYKISNKVSSKELKNCTVVLVKKGTWLTFSFETLEAPSLKYLISQTLKEVLKECCCYLNFSLPERIL